jgi:hypothetical protein
MNQLQRTPVVNSHPESISDHVLPHQEHTSQSLFPSHGNNDRDTTHPESDLRHQRIILRDPPIETDPTKRTRTTFPKTNATVTCARAMDQDYPLTGPSPGTNQHTYPSSLPPDRGNLLSNISSKSHCFWSFTYQPTVDKTIVLSTN